MLHRGRRRAASGSLKFSASSNGSSCSAALGPIIAAATPGRSRTQARATACGGAHVVANLHDALHDRNRPLTVKARLHMPLEEPAVGLVGRNSGRVSPREYTPPEVVTANTPT